MIRETRWNRYPVSEEYARIAKELNIDPVMAQVMLNRGQDSPEKREKYLYGALEDLPDPELLLNCRKAAEMLAAKIREGKHIRIVSDYDVDGVTSNYVLLKGLEKLGAHVTYDIPDRIRDGYGMNVRIVEDASRDGVDTILTCDNGTAAFEAIHLAKEKGMTVIVTDHHQVQGELPEADALVNPWQQGCPYPFKEICGVEVAYKVLQVLSAIMEKPLARGEFLEFVALGTICDVMPIVEENRIVVKEGLRRMAETTCTGLRALLSVNSLLGSKITVYHCGFIIGPSINSEGRLGSAREAMKLLLMTDPEKAEKFAETVKELNESRKVATEQGVKAAFDTLDPVNGGAIGNVLVIYIKDLHESLAGIVAGRVRGRYYRPVIILTDTENDPDILKGSGRSIEGYNMFEKLCEVKDLLDHFGGHKMAAGLSLKRENLNLLRERLNQLDGLTEEDLIETVDIDVCMPISYASLGLAEQFEQLEPFGTGSPKPQFAEKDLQIVSIESFGKKGTVAKLKLQDIRGNRVELTAFQSDELLRDIKLWSEAEECDTIKDNAVGGQKVAAKTRYPKIDVIYTVSINEFRGRNVQCELKYYRKSAD